MFDRRVLRCAASCILIFAASASSARAQCLDWSTVGGGMNDTVHALTVFDNGNGPALYAGGWFTSVDGVPMSRIAKWNGTRWSPLGAGVDGVVTSLIVFDDGTGPALYVGGWFGKAGGSPANRLAKWDGASWSPADTGIPVGFQYQVHALCIYDDGGGPALYASHGNPFVCNTAGGTVSKLIGGIWTTIGTTDDVVSALAVHDDGSGPALYAGGYFNTMDNVPAWSIARWDGASWSAVGGGMALGGGFCAPVTSLAEFDDGSGPDLYAGGKFKQAGSACTMSIARWDGTSWSALGLGLSQVAACCTTIGCGAGSTSYALAVFDDGSSPSLVAAGSIFGAGGMSASHAVKWDGSAWSTLGSGTNNIVYALAVFDDGLGGGPDLYAGGQFTTAGGGTANRIARWRGCGGPATHFCPGDGSAAACPCSNNGIALRGCQNSQSTGGALLQATGTIVPDAVKLFASGELPNSLTIFLQGRATAAPGVPFGDGLRCVTGFLKRLYTKNASLGHASAPTGAELSITARSAALGDPIAAGQRRYYQTYYRDGDETFCPLPTGRNFNSSSGLKIVW